MEVRKPGDLIKVAQQKFVKTVEQAKANNDELLTVDELVLINRQNSDIITLQIVNTTPGGEEDKDITIAFGTPLGVAEEYQNVPLYSTIPNHFLDNLDYLTDNQGAQVPFLRLLDRRFIRNPIIVQQIEVITDDSAAGQTQATKQITMLEIPYNSATDSAKRIGAYVAKFTEFTATYLLNRMIPFGDFVGSLYDVVTDADVLFNIHIAGISRPTFPINK